MKVSIRPGFLVVVGASLLLAGCAEPAYVAAPPPVVSQPGYVVVSQPPPPAPQQVVVASPGPNYIWVPGYWAWQGRWVWVSGAWVARPRPQVVWVPGYWSHRSHGYIWV